MNNLHPKLIFLILLFLSGCDQFPSQSSSADTILNIPENCASQPPTELILREVNVKEITLTSSLETIDKKRLNSTKTIGYKFQGKTGQKLHLELTEGVCIWMIDPNNKVSNQLVKQTTLTETGTYLVQLAVPTEQQVNYTLSMGLDVRISSSTPTPTPTPSFRFSLSNFPKPRCGDDLPSNIDAYPVKFYPVFVPLSQDNLNNVTNNFCKDSFPKIRKDTKVKEIQVSSFSSLEKAKQFVKFLEDESIDASVGEPTVIESPR